MSVHVTAALTGVELLAQNFPAAMSREAVIEMRDSIDMTKNTEVFGFLAMCTLDRDAMVDAIRSMREQSGDDEASSILPCIASVRENFERMAKIANTVEARLIVAAHVAFDEEWIDWSTPKTVWDETPARYDAALAVELAYYAEHIEPYVPADLPVGPERNAAVGSIPKEVWDEVERLTDLRCGPEDELLDMPSPDLTAFARKVIICRADERNLDGLDGMLVAEARRLTSAMAA
jgi:hypothetical protein